MGKTNQSTVIKASVDKVWESISEFHDMGWAPNVITDLKVVGDTTGRTVGAKRILNDAFHETLKSLDQDTKTFTYQITDGPSPLSKDEISNYIGQVKVMPAETAGETTVEWTSSWENKDEEVGEFCHNIYVALLADMKKSLE